ncbi:MAG: MerR family transcriptional regulator [Hungatella sp.]|jgi:DNA-binding transcriptional MerR regulator|nr:MerR family transcriptional regulator [Hungatella sp.]
MYTIGQISDMFNIPISTLRYYDKEGLFPDIQRRSGIRIFSDREVEKLRMIECLKKTGMEIRDIREFMLWCQQGAETYEKRRDMLLRQKKAVEAEMERMSQVLDMIRYKCWYYDQAIQDGNEERLHSITLEDMPEDIRKAYENSF